MSRRQRRRRGRRICPECREVFHTTPRLERHAHIHRVAAEAGQSFEEAANAVAELVLSGVLVEQRDGNLKINEDRAADLFGDREAS